MYRLCTELRLALPRSIHSKCLDAKDVEFERQKLKDVPLDVSALLATLGFPKPLQGGSQGTEKTGVCQRHLLQKRLDDDRRILSWTS